MLEVGGGTAKVKCLDEIKDVDCSLTPGLRRGDYVLIHGGLAVQKLDRKDAEETLALLDEVCRRPEAAKPLEGVRTARR